jgi:DnaJ-class molecular chaperone
MAASTEDRTGKFNVHDLRGKRCPDCDGSGQLRIDSENINENFDVEKQTVITECPTCVGTGFVAEG